MSLTNWDSAPLISYISYLCDIYVYDLLYSEGGFTLPAHYYLLDLHIHLQYITIYRSPQAHWCTDSVWHHFTLCVKWCRASSRTKITTFKVVVSPHTHTYTHVNRRGKSEDSWQRRSFLPNMVPKNQGNYIWLQYFCDYQQIKWDMLNWKQLNSPKCALYFNV